MTPQALVFIHGAITLACLLIAVKFLKFWRTSNDRFFLWFSAAFLVFSIAWAVSVFAPTNDDGALYVFMPRLVGFSLIIGAVLDKNRSSRA